MMADTKISYADKVWNPCCGCTPIASGCLNCWAKQLHNQRQFAWAEGRWPDAPVQYHKAFGKVQLLPERLEQPIHWRKPRTIFVNSMSDTFHKDVPFAFIDKMFNVMERTRRHKFLLFTKRWDRVIPFLQWRDKATEQHVLQRRFLTKHPLPNVHLYFSASTQAEVDEAVPILLQIPAEVRGLSLEPLLEPIDLTRINMSFTEKRNVLNGHYLTYFKGSGISAPNFGNTSLDSIIVGCESGPNRRPCEIEWIRSIVNQCQKASVPVYIKQISVNGRVTSKMDDFPKDLQVRNF